MASSMAVPRPGRSAGSGIGRSIPVVTHPMAKLGDMSELTIRGTSSLGQRQKSDLTVLKLKDRATTAEKKAPETAPPTRQSCPDRILQWPPVCEHQPPYSYRKSAMPPGFLPKIEEEKTFVHNRTLPIEVVERSLKGPKREILKLPSISKVVEKLEQQREYLVGPKATAVKTEDIQLTPHFDKVQELTDVVRDKLTTGYYGLRHLFRANDPNGNGNVSREALLRILYSLCGFITRDQYSKFLKSIGLDGKETISFDGFVGCFKENETVQKQWVSPVQRSALEDALKRRHPEEQLKLDLKRFDPYTSAPFSDAIFKSKMKTIDDAKKVFPAVCFDPDGMIVPPQLREAYAQIGIYLHDSDFQVLWDRYDVEGSGGIRTIPFLRKLGCEINPRPKTFHRSHTQVPVKHPQRPKSDCYMVKSQDITEKIQHDVETTVTERQKTEVKGGMTTNTNDKTETTVENEKTSVTETESKPKPMKPTLKKGKPKLDNIIDCLHYRFEEAYNAMLTAFELFDHLSDGYISRVDFRRVLQEFGFNISITDLDHFLSSIEKLGKKLNDKKLSKTFKSVFGNRLHPNKATHHSNHRNAEKTVSDKETIVTFGKNAGVGSRHIKTAWTEEKEQDSNIKTDLSSMNNHKTNYSEKTVSDRRKTAQFGNSSFNRMAKAIRERKEQQETCSAVVGKRCFSRVSEKVQEETIDHDKRCVSVGNTSVSVETKTTNTRVSTVDIRASIRSIRGQINYKDFLYKYQSKSDNSITNRIVTNQSHVFQHDAQPLPNSNLSVDQMEAKLVDYFHGDFLKLVSFLRSCDKYGLGVITPHEFRSALEKRLGYAMSENQWEQLKEDVGQDKDGLIQFNKFLQLFDVMPGSWNKTQEGGVDVVKLVKADLPQPPEEVYLLKERAKTMITPREKPKLDGSGNRTIIELKKQLEELFKNKFHTFDKHFKQMDRKMMGRMSKWQFGALVKLCGLSMNQQELDKVWATLSVANDGMYSYSALIRHFIQFKPRNKSEQANVTVTEDTTDLIEEAHKVQRERREKKAQESQALQENVKEIEEKEQPKTPPASAASVKSLRTKDLLIKIKPDVISNWEGLKSVLKYIDKNGCATVNYNEMTEVMDSMKFNLTPEEQKELIQRFDYQKNGRFHYLEFMKCFSHRPAPTPRYKSLVYSKHQHKLQQRQRDIGTATIAQVINNVRKKLMTEHRNLKRAFKKLDRQNKGFLSVLDFKKALTSCKVNFSNEDFYHLLSEFDHDMTGKISYQDFLTTFMNAR